MTDELTWLRSLEQDVQRLRTYTGMPESIAVVTADNLATSLKVKINNRIIELLEARQEERRKSKERCPTRQGPMQCVLNEGHPHHCAFTVEDMHECDGTNCPPRAHDHKVLT